MAHKLKSKKFHFSFAVVLRLVIFTVIIYLSIIYFSSNQASTPSILGQTTSPTVKPYFDQFYQALPPQSRSAIENFSSLPQVTIIQGKIDFIKTETADFPQKQIRDIQKAVVNQIYSNIIKTIDKP